MRLSCPFCGERDAGEFSPMGDATVPRPQPSAGIDAFYEYVYLRDNPRGLHKEFWQHSQGCRAWLIVERDTATHEVKLITAAAGANSGAERS